MKKIIKNFFIFLILVLIGFILYSFFYEKPKDINASLKEKVSRISEINILRYDYEVTKVYTSESATWFKIPIKGLVDVAAVTFPGTIKFGFSLKDVEIIEPEKIELKQTLTDKIPYFNQYFKHDDILNDKTPNEVIIKIPHASILSHEIHWEEMGKPITLKNSPFSSFTYEDFKNNTVKLKTEFENRAKEKGLFEEADNSAIEQITNLFKPLLSENQTLEVVFK